MQIELGKNAAIFKNVIKVELFELLSQRMIWNKLLRKT